MNSDARGDTLRRTSSRLFFGNALSAPTLHTHTAHAHTFRVLDSRGHRTSSTHRGHQ